MKGMLGSGVRTLCRHCGALLVSGVRVAGPGCGVCSARAVSLGVAGRDAGAGVDAGVVEGGSVGARAERLLRRVLADGEWHAGSVVMEAAALVGVNRRAWERAARRLGVEHRKTSSFPACSEFRLPLGAGLEDPGGDPEPVEGVVAGELAERPVLEHESQHQHAVPPAGWRDGGGSWQTERF